MNHLLVLTGGLLSLLVLIYLGFALLFAEKVS